MTQNQIEYWKLQESLRHNQAVEAESERAARAQLAETKRANKAREAETHRANAANEALGALNVYATNKRNEIEKQKVHDTYNTAMLDYYLRGSYNDRYFELANQQLTQDWNKAQLQYKSSIYGADASKIVGLTNAQYNYEVGMQNARNNLILGQERNAIQQQQVNDQFILQSSRNKTERDQGYKRLEIQQQEADTRYQQMQNQAFQGAANILTGIGGRVIGMAS